MLLLLAFTKYDFGGIAMLVVALLVITGCVKPNTALAKFADSNVIIIAAMMMCAAGFSKTRAVKSIGNLLFKVSGGSFERCCGMFMVVLFAMGFVLPGAVGRIAIAYPIMMEVCRRYDRSPSKIMFPVGCMMLCDQTGFPIGGAAVTYAKYNGFLENAGYTFGDSFSIMEPFIARIPVCIIMLIYFMTIGVKIAPEKPALAIEALKVKAKKEERELTKFQEIAAYIIFLGTCLCLVFYSKMGIPQWIVPFAGAILMYAVGANNVRESINAMPINLMMLLIGAFVMSEALLETGTGEWVGNLAAMFPMVNALGDEEVGITALIESTLGGLTGLSPFLFLFILVIATGILTQFMNNGATANLFIPIAIMTCNTLGCSAKGLIMIIQNASLVAWFMPTATAIIPMLMEGGGYDLKTMIKQGLPPALLKSVCQIAWIAFMFPAYPG